MKPPAHILIFRFSSLGDVAMTVPVVRLLLAQHPGLRVTYVSVPFVAPLFTGMPRLSFIGADVKKHYKGLPGLYQLYRRLSSDKSIDAVADLHNVLRTKVLRFFFAAQNTPVAVLDKGRQEKKKLTRRYNKIVVPLPTTFERYATVFEQLGFPLALTVQQGITRPTGEANAQWQAWKEEGFRLIGVAPFAQYAEKTYPPHLMRQVIDMLLTNKRVKVFLLGGKTDVPAMQAFLSANHANLYSLAGTMSFEEELRLISQLHLMISMDSANMHLASLYGVPVVSIWGGTHPFLGFNGWGQPFEHCVQIDLDCRPSSVFGNKPCPRELACLQGITPLSVVAKVWQLLG